MRHDIWKPSDFFLISGERFDMEAGVVTLPDDIVPVAWGYGGSDFDILGRIEDLKCEDGVIGGEVTWLEPERIEPLLETDFRLGGYYTHVEKADGVVTACTLRSVSLLPKSTMPGAE